MLMIDPAAAFAETRRVLRLGGRLAFSVWAAQKRNPTLSLVGRVLHSQGHIPPPDPEAPSALAMADPGYIRELVVGAGFADGYWRYVTETAASASPIPEASRSRPATSGSPGITATWE